MLCQMSRQARVDALLHSENHLKELCDILEPGDMAMDDHPVPLQPTEVADILAKAPCLLEVDYNSLLDYLHQTGRLYRAFSDLPHPPNAIILPPQAQHLLQVHRDECTFSCEKSHEGNSAIKFYNPLTQAHDTGFIQNIWRLPLEGIMHTFIRVRSHQSLSTQEERQAPFIHHPGFMVHIVDALPSNNLSIIEPVHIITHVTTVQRPAGTYGIGRKVLVVCWAPNRGRQ
jgi:hypothetical protein